MNRKRISAAILAGALATSVLAGCGKQGNTGTTELSTENRVSTEAVTETVGETQTNETQIEETQNETSQMEDTQNEQPQYPEIISKGKVKKYESVVTVGDAGYELYTYLDDTASNYAKSVNKTADALNGKADVYDIVIPLSSEITFPDNLRDQINSSNQGDAMEKIRGMMDEKVHTVDIYDSLMEHRLEYIYFRTDHHWTALGAYYAYEDFCEAKGMEPATLDSYETQEFEGFLGSFYNDTGDAKLKANPDTVTAYLPKSDSILHVTASDGTKYDWPVIYDVSNYGASLKYSTFIASDNPYTEIENKSLSDNSACIVVKESFGNAFVPFLVDHYQTIYVIDYRYWTGSICELAEEKGATDVIFLNNLSMIRNKSLVGKLHRVV